MKESPKKQNGKRNLLPWLLLGILAVCVVILLFLYGRQSGYTVLKTESSQTESTVSSGEGSTSSGKTSSSNTSSRSSSSRSTSSRSTSSRTGSQEEETESVSAAESLPESLGEIPTPILSQSETSSTPVGNESASSGEESPSSQTNSREISGLTIQWESEDLYAFAQLWGEYAQLEPLFSALEGQGTPVMVYLYAAEGTDTVVWEDTCYRIFCYGESGSMEQIYWDAALLLEEVLRQQGKWEESAGTYQTFNPNGFTYGNPQALYVGRYFCSLESQQSLAQDRLEVWQLVLQEQEPVYGALLEKYYCLRSAYNGIF